LLGFQGCVKRSTADGAPPQSARGTCIPVRPGPRWPPQRSVIAAPSALSRELVSPCECRKNERLRVRRNRHPLAGVSGPGSSPSRDAPELRPGRRGNPPGRMDRPLRRRPL